MTTIADQIRILVALIAIKHKPQDQSITAYILDLQTRFGGGCSGQEHEVSRWRKRALELEHECEQLNAKYESEHIKVLTMINAAPTTQSPSDVGPAKKKIKKRQAIPSTDPDKVTPSRASDISKELISFSIEAIGSESLFSSLKDIHYLISLPNPDKFLLVSATERLLKAVNGFLGCLIRGISSVSSPKTLRTLGKPIQMALSNVFQASSTSRGQERSPSSHFPIELSSHHIFHIIERTTTLVLYPLLKAFGALTTLSLHTLFPSGAAGVHDTTKPSDDIRPPGRLDPPINHARHQPSVTDVRPEALILFGSILTTLDSHLRASTPADVPHPPLALSTLWHSLIAETVRALHQLLSTHCSTMPPATHEEVAHVGRDGHRVRDRLQRVEALILKDTLWYLCAVLHLLFKDPLPAENQGGEVSSSEGTALNEVDDSETCRLLLNLKETVSGGMYRLVLNCKRKQFQPWATINGGPAGGAVVGTRQDCTSERKRPESGAPTGTDEDGDGVSTAGLSCNDNGKSQNAVGPGREQVSSASEESPEAINDGIYWLDDAEFDLLLGTIERYWVWNEC